MEQINLIEDFFEKILNKVLNNKLEKIWQDHFQYNSTHIGDEIMTAKEIANLLKISKPTLFKKMKDGTIPYTRVGRRILFKKNEVINSLKRKN